MNASAAAAATTPVSDAALVDAVRAGDESAFEELYRRYSPSVLSFVQRRVHDEGRAEDLTQEAFFSALRRLRETDSKVAFRPWIYEIARNATIDHFRRQVRSEEVSVDSVDNLPPDDHLRLVGDRGPERELATKQQLETLRGAFAELSDKHERILVMRELEGLSYRQIGEQMELTRPGVESTLFRARRRLEREFGDLETGRRCLISRRAMGRLAEGLELRGERGKVERHVRRCTACRATARELGLAPERPSRAARVAAFIPLPAFMVRRLGAASGQGAELAGAFGAKGTALVAALALAGGGAGVGAVSVADRGDRGAPGGSGPSAGPRSGHPEVAPGGHAPASPRSPTRARPPAAAARRKPSRKLGPRKAQAPPKMPARRGLERRPSAPPGAGTDLGSSPAAPHLPMPRAGALKRGSAPPLGDRASSGRGVSETGPPSGPPASARGPKAPPVAPTPPQRSARAPAGAPAGY